MPFLPARNLHIGKAIEGQHVRFVVNKCDGRGESQLDFRDRVTSPQTTHGFLG